MQNLLKGLEGLCKLANVFGEVLEDGKVNMLDLSKMPELIGVLSLFTNVNYTELISEIKELNSDSKNILVAKFKEYFDLPQDNLETKIEAIVELLSQIALSTKEFIKLFKKN